MNPQLPATKIRWLIENVDSVNRAIKDGRARFGTLDSWLLFNMTKERTFATDLTNASKTLLAGLDGTWNSELLSLFQLDSSYLPNIRGNTEIFGTLSRGSLAGVPVSGLIAN